MIITARPMAIPHMAMRTAGFDTRSLLSLPKCIRFAIKKGKFTIAIF